MARLQFYCAFCGMPAVTLLKGTAVCNNDRCQRKAGLDELASPAGPQGEQSPHGLGLPRRVPGPNEVPTVNVRKIPQGTLCRGATGLEVQNVDDITNKLHICHPEELVDVIMFIREHFREEWQQLLQVEPDLQALEGHGGSRYFEKINLAAKAKEVRVELEERCQSFSPGANLQCSLSAADEHTTHRNGRNTWAYAHEARSDDEQ